MKKLIILPIILWTAIITAQSDRTLSFGWQWGIHSNESYFSGGMNEASGRFHQNKYLGVGFSFLSRYDINERWNLTAGIGYYSYGFDFGVSDNYTLSKFAAPNTEGNNIVHTDLQAFEMPFMGYLKGKLDCHNSRWIVGAGFSATFFAPKKSTEFIDPNNEGDANASNLSSEVNAPSGAGAFLKFSAGREKVCKNGSIFHVEFALNVGVSEMARATVKYSADGKEYMHEFTNNGNFAGVRFVFYCGRCSSKIGPKK